MKHSTRIARVMVFLAVGLLLAAVTIAAVVDYKGRSVIDSPTGAGGVIIKANTVMDADRIGTYETQAGAPDVNDDINAATPAYVNSIWEDSDTSRLYRCIDNADGAAVWREAVTGSPQQEIVPPGSTIQAIIDDITDATANKPYVVLVPPGVYTEQITMKDYVSLKGAGMYATKITVVGENENDFTTIRIADQVEISDMTIEATGIGYAISDYQDPGAANSTVAIRNCYINGSWDYIVMMQDGVTIYVSDCICIGDYDGFTQMGTNTKLYVYSSKLFINNSAHECNGVFRTADASGETYAFDCHISGTITDASNNFYIINSGGKMRLYNVDVAFAVTSTGDIYGIRSADADADIEVYGGSVVVANAGAGDAYDLFRSNGSTKVFGTTYSTVSGTVGGFGTVGGVLRLGDTTNRLSVSATGDQTFAGSAGFYPRTLSQDGKPAAGTGVTQCDSGEYLIWIDTNDSNKVYGVYNNGGTVVAVLMAL